MMKNVHTHRSSETRNLLGGIRYVRGLGLVTTVALCSGCATLGAGVVGGRGGPSAPQSTIAVDIANASRSSFSDDIERSSQSMHHFLVGQISLGEENYQTALEHFEKADKLADEPSALIHTKLADLYVRFGKLEQARAAAERAMADAPEEPYVRMLYAGILEGLGSEDQAEPIYRGLVEEFPARVEGYLLLANLHMKRKNFAAAEGVLMSLVRNQPQEPVGHLYLGRVFESQDKLAKAEKEYEWVFERDPSLSNGAPELLRVLVRQNKLPRVKQVSERILQKDPDNALARKVLSYIMIGESKLDDALEHLTALESLETDPTETRFRVALIQIEKQNYREAIRELSLVLAKNPNHAEARYYLASLYAGSGRRKEAIDELDAIEKDSPMYVKAKTFAAFVLRQEGELSESLEAIDEALSVHPENSNLILYSVLVLRDMQEYRKAESRLRSALEVAPDDERLLFNLGLVLHERGERSQAITTMERVVQSNPKNSDALNYVAYALAEQGVELERAQSVVTQALVLRPNDGFYLDTLGFIYLKQGKLKDAEETLSRAVALTGHDPVIVEHYVQALLQQEKRQEATAVLKSVVEQVLSEEDARDRDKKDALDRLKRQLREMLDRYPELRDVQKSRYTPKVPQQQRAQVPQGIELLEEFQKGGSAS